MNHGRSFTLSAVAVVVLYVVAYLWHALVSGTFALPPAVLAVLAPLTPVVVYLLQYVTHGLLTGDWQPPLPLLPLGSARTGQASPPAPPPTAPR